MIHTLGLMDTLRVAALRSPDLAAFPPYAAAAPQPALGSYAFVFERLRYRRSSVALVALDQGRLAGLASARKRSGPTTWFVDHLALPGGDASLCELLGSVSEYATKHGVERLFLRLPDEWDIQKLACQSGFVVSTQVLLATLPGRSPLYKDGPAVQARVRRSEDDHGLFRLYNACTPAEVRYKTGLTLQQWKDGEEQKTRRTREVVVTHDDDVVAWVRLDYHQGWTKVCAMTHPRGQVDIPSLVAYVVRSGGRKGIVWEVPEYQADLHLLLERMGFEISGCYRLLVNSLAPMIKEPAWAPAPTSV